MCGLSTRFVHTGSRAADGLLSVLDFPPAAGIASSGPQGTETATRSRGDGKPRKAETGSSAGLLPLSCSLACHAALGSTRSARLAAVCPLRPIWGARPAPCEGGRNGGSARAGQPVGRGPQRASSLARSAPASGRWTQPFGHACGACVWTGPVAPWCGQRWRASAPRTPGAVE